MLPAPPLRDVLDDEEVLARPDIAEHPRLAGEDGERRRTPETPLERRLLLPQLPNGRDPDRTLRARVEVIVERPVVEEPYEQERPDREPAASDWSTEAPAALLPRSHPARVLPRGSRSFG